MVSSLKLENRLKKHVQNVARIKYGFIELVVILFTLRSKVYESRYMAYFPTRDNKREATK